VEFRRDPRVPREFKKVFWSGGEGLGNTPDDRSDLDGVKYEDPRMGEGRRMGTKRKAGRSVGN